MIDSKPKLLVGYSTATAARWISLIAALALAVQFFISDDTGIVVLIAITFAIGVLGIVWGGLSTTSGWLALFYVFGNVFIAVVAKTILRQPIESNLVTPFLSFLMVAVASVQLTLAIAIARFVPTGRPIFTATTDTRLLNHLTSSTLLLGVLAWSFNRLSQDPDGSGFGGVAVFWNLLLLSVICRTASNIVRSGGKHSFDFWLAFLLCVCTVVGVVENTKTAVALPFVAYFVTCLFFRGGLTARQLLAAICMALLIAVVVGPAIHVLRVFGIQETPWSQRFALIRDGIGEASRAEDLERFEEIAELAFRRGYYDYFGDGKGQLVLGRYASIQQIDPVVAEVSRQGTLSSSVIWGAFHRLVPAFLAPNKPEFPEDYQIVLALGLIDLGGGKYPTVPIVAQSYAGFGEIGVATIPFLAFLLFLLIFKKLGWTLKGNVYAIFFFCTFLVVYAHQGSLAHYAGAALRNFPLLAGAIWLLVKLHRQPRRRAPYDRQAPLPDREIP